MFFSPKLSTLGVYATSDGQMITNVFRLRNIWKEIYVPRKTAGNTHISLNYDPFIYYLFSVLKDLNRKEQLPVDKLLARGAN